MIDLTLACACCDSPGSLDALTDVEFVALCDAVEEFTGEQVLKVSEREAAVERSLAKDLDRAYRATLDPALEVEMVTLPAGDVLMDEVEVMLNGVDRRLRAAGFAVVADLVTAAGSTLTLISRRATRAAVAALGKSVAEVAGNLTLADTAAMTALGEQQVWWVGNYWNEHLSRSISATVSREALTTGLGRAEVGRIVRGVVEGEFPAAAVPGGFRGTSEHYFRSLAGTVRNRASNFGAIRVMQEAQIRRYRISAVMDKRTSAICRFMNSREFSVRSGARLIDRTFDAGDPAAVRAASPWVSAGKAGQIAGDGDAKSQEVGLESAGLQLPPYHGS